MGFHLFFFQVPGDVVLDLSNMTNQTIKLGSGLRQVSFSFNFVNSLSCVCVFESKHYPVGNLILL